jgi:uncharacterized oxidoreductase
MKITGNTILITGGGSGIGRALAHAFHEAGNQVIVAGRRMSALEETIAGRPGMKALTLDVEDPAAIREFAARVVTENPALNVLINNAGIMREENILEQSEDLADAEAIITTNLLGPLRLTAALLSHLREKSDGAIINVSSGLAFVPLAATPTYNATKAAIHSYTQSLRFQVRDTPLQILEIIPPGVATELTPGQSERPGMMPLEEFIAETMSILENQPDAPEICVEYVKSFRYAEQSGNYEAVFNRLNGGAH